MISRVNEILHLVKDKVLCLYGRMRSAAYLKEKGTLTSAQQQTFSSIASLPLSYATAKISQGETDLLGVALKPATITDS